MKLNKNQFALASGRVMGIVYVVCAVFILLWSDFSLKLFGWLVHLVNVDKFAGDVQVTFVGFIGGLLQSIIYASLFGWLFAWLHNRFMKSEV